ncbi:glycosyltransferase family 2 protein [candidate division KSB1 bacterium]|nr:glycosyltransferase family 2 protein [candidate division KSB1 bacterium]RQW01923.1 MAG: glycosyltransferase family 2 protein [candidate division KSB1 bacterium]
MKLIIQIPCYNEEKTLPLTFSELPRQINGIDEIEYLIINDGSDDRTVEVARELGIHHVISFPKNKGLAKGFMAGLDASLRLGADIIVNTDADNQYAGADIEKLVEPILKGEAELVVGDRQTNGIHHFSWFKKRLQRWGSWVVRHVSDTSVPDATSGFRALSREAALQMNVVSEFTYTLETIIQAGKKNLAISHVPIRTNGKLRESRLFRGNWSYIKRSIGTIARIYTMYEPLRMFSFIGAILFGLGLLIGLRFVYFYITSGGAGHIQSLILTAVLLIVGFQVFVFGLMADMIGSNRRLIEDALYRLKKMEHSGSSGK